MSDQPAPGSVSVAADFPRFVVPGHETAMQSLRSLYWLHYESSGPIIPLWDEWIPKATLWPARDGDRRQHLRRSWKESLSTRPMSDEGYVRNLQDDSAAHADGWPFPNWESAGGIGWHFRRVGVEAYDVSTVDATGWEITGGRIVGMEPRGLEIELGVSAERRLN